MSTLLDEPARLTEPSPDSDAATDAWFAEAIRVCQMAAQGDFEPRLLHADRTTPQGQLSIAINDLLDRADAFVRESAASLDHASKGQFFRRVLPNGMVGAYRQAADIINSATSMMADKSAALAHHQARREELANELETSVGSVASALADSAESLRQTARQLAVLSQDTSRAANEGKQFSDIAADHVKHVADVGNQLVASEQTVEDRARQSKQVADSAVRDAARTSDLMKQLSEANRCIGDVVSLIANIARQTNLLALNASIEAARAGEAGRGFAVVAVEVKKLSEQTAAATKRISTEVAAVRSASTNTAQAIDAVDEKIKSLSQLATSIDQAVHEQLIITEEIQSRLKESDHCVARTSSSIHETGQVAERTKETADDLLASADHVSSQTAALTATVQKFLAHIRRDA